MRFAAALLVLVAACTVSPSASQFPSPTPSSKAPSVYAVMVKDFLDGGPTYTVSLVATDGHVAAGSTVPKRTVRSQIGSLSTSNTTLYYLDGDADIQFLRPEPFAKGSATHVALGPNQVAAFAVSPDDRRIAVSVLDYTRFPVSTRLYVEDLNSGANHIELFSSPTVLEWPAGWHNGALVMAVGINARPQNSGGWFARGSGYQVLNAQTGDRIRSVCDGRDSFVPESPAGTVCSKYPDYFVESWDGASRPLSKEGICGMSWGPLSPSGVIAKSCGASGTLRLFTADGKEDPRPLGEQSLPEGWIDSNHLVVTAYGTQYAAPGSVAPVSIVDVKTGAAVTVTSPQGIGFFAAALPGGL